MGYEATIQHLETEKLHLQKQYRQLQEQLQTIQNENESLHRVKVDLMQRLPINKATTHVEGISSTKQDLEDTFKNFETRIQSAFRSVRKVMAEQDIDLARAIFFSTISYSVFQQAGILLSTKEAVDLLMPAILEKIDVVQDRTSAEIANTIRKVVLAGINLAKRLARADFTFEVAFVKPNTLYNEALHESTAGSQDSGIILYTTFPGCLIEGKLTRNPSVFL